MSGQALTYGDVLGVVEAARAAGASDEAAQVLALEMMRGGPMQEWLKRAVDDLVAEVGVEAARAWLAEMVAELESAA